jgi:hypothetical protein
MKYVYMGQIMAECDCQHYGCKMKGYCMAERIEQLVKERDEAERNETLCSNMAVNYLERAEVAEAKLAAIVLSFVWLL